MIRFIKYLLSFLILISVLTDCKKDETENPPANPPVTPTPFNLQFSFNVDGQPFVFDSIKYTNQAGNNYGVTTLAFYLSQIYLLKPDSEKVAVANWLYVDAGTPGTLINSFSNVPEGSYIGMTFNIGLDSVQNVPGGLPATNENLAMEWPVYMGGGYHFLKLEGYFTDTSGTPGFAMHLGTNICLCPVKLSGNICVGKNCLTNLSANINEWFKNPYTFDFNIDGNYIMGNAAAMTKISGNGADVFSIQ